MNPSSILELSVIPVIAAIVWMIGYLLTYLLRHRLHLIATTSRRTMNAKQGRHEAGLEHVCVVQNLEDIDMSIPFQVQVSTLNVAGHIMDVRIVSGRRGPDQTMFTKAGHERYVLTVHGMAAHDIWKIVCRTNDEAERVRFSLRGWDLKRETARWWIPTFPLGGLALTSRPSGVASEYARDAKRAGWIALALLIVGYLSLVRGLAGLKPEGSKLWPLNVVSEYVHGLFPGWQGTSDWIFLGALIFFGLLTRALIVRDRRVNVSLGYLDNEYIGWRLRNSGLPSGESPRGSSRG